jgi:hypothetical protein
MQPKIISWNVRGMNEYEKRIKIRRRLREWKADIVCLQETKMEVINAEVVRSVWGCVHVDWIYLGARGASGGILLMWDRRVVEKIEDCVGRFVVACLFRSVTENWEWAFAGVYGPNDDGARSILWDELSGLMNVWEKPWCIGGDFNVVRHSGEKLRASRQTQVMTDFADFISEQGLIDLPMLGGRITWSNRRTGSRLDRFLISTEWEESFPEVIQKRLPRVISDHFPVMLVCGPRRRGRLPFRFENMWLQEEGFVEQVKRWWDSYQVEGNPSYVMARKLKALKGDLKKWNVEVFGVIEKRKKSLEEELGELDCIGENRELMAEEIAKRDECYQNLERTLFQEEVSWRQKSRALWLKEGDRNTSYFHRVVNSHRRNNTMAVMMMDGNRTEDPAVITNHIVQFYKTLYSEQYQGKPIRLFAPMMENLNSIDEGERVWMEREFGEEEVWEVVRKMKGDKAPGPDGFSMAFFQKCWKVIKKDIMAVFKEFHETEKFEKSLNATFVALIPKKAGAMEIKDFRPISLISGVYKIISKVLTSRLKSVMGKLVSQTQSAFVPGRQILDSIFMANECVDSRIRSGEPGLICKLDLEKAYDHINWDFLLYMLERFGFGDRWRGWMYQCVSTVRFSVLINGTPEDFFDSSRGVRQGDPLSPLLFVMVMEAFSRMMNVMMEKELLAGFSVGSRSEEAMIVSHLLFADDTLIFCEPKVEQIQHLRCLLLCFEAVSGLKINLSKSTIVPIGMVGNLEVLSNILGCRVESLPLTYLGLPLGANHRDTSIWDTVIGKMEAKLAGWKRMYLSKGGRLTLIKSTLSNIPTYYLSLFQVPVRVAKRLEKIQRDFLWGGVGDEFKFHLVNWSKICMTTEAGGLGVRNLVHFNQALLGKWLWRFANEEEAWWRKLVVAKYDKMRGGWCSKEVGGTHGLGLWKSIRRGWDTFKHYVRFEVGNGSRVLFWKDVWCGERPLMNAFPALFAIACEKDAWVKENMDIVNGVTQWNVLFIRSVHDWELEEVSRFFELLYSHQIRHGGEDKICWTPLKKKNFEVKSYYKVRINLAPVDGPWRSIWKSKAPSRVIFFVWTAALGKILTMDNLRKKNIIVTEWCCMCKKSGESIVHLLLHCEVAMEVWNMVCQLFGVMWVMPSSVTDCLGSWRTQKGNRTVMQTWRMVPLCVMWCIWRERNARIFEDRELGILELKKRVIQTLFSWRAMWHSPQVTTLADFLDFCATFSS